MNRADTVGASRDTVLMLDFLFFHPNAPKFYNLAQIGTNRGRNGHCVTGALANSVDPDEMLHAVAFH